MADSVDASGEPPMMEWAAVLFDLDGTIADTESAHGIAYKLAFADLGILISERAFAEVAGKHHLEVIRALSGGNPLIDESTLHQSKSSFFHDIAKVHVRPLPLLRVARTLKGTVPVGLVTSASSQTAQVILEVIGAQGLFDVVITSDLVRRHKPHPEPYLTACRVLGVTPESSVAFEDSVSGYESASSAGVNVVKVGQLIG